MQTFPTNYAANINRQSYAVAYVAEMIWADGLKGVEGQDDIYIGTVELEQINGFPFSARYAPYLMHDSISTITERFDERNGNSSIGTMSVDILDKDAWFTKIIRRAEADKNQSLRRQRIELYALTADQQGRFNWSDKVKVRTMNINGRSFNPAKSTYTIRAQSILAAIRKKLFQPYTTTLAANIPATGGFTLQLTDATNFISAGDHSTFTSVTGGPLAAFFKVGDETLMGHSKTGNNFTVPAGGRGMFGSAVAAATAGDDVQEVAVLKGNPYHIAMRVLTSGNGKVNSYDVLPDHWGVALDYTDTPSSVDIDYLSFEEVGNLCAGWDGTLESGIEREFVFSEAIDGKQLLEKHILMATGAFGRTLGDGTYSCKKIDRTPNAPINMVTNAVDATQVDRLLTGADIVELRRYEILDQELSTQMRLNYYARPGDGRDFTRHAMFIDAAAALRHGRDGKLIEHNIFGIQANATNTLNLFQTFNAIQARFASPPVAVEVEALSMHHDIEVGDIVGIDYNIEDAGFDWRKWATLLSDYQVLFPSATKFIVEQGERVVTPDNDQYVAVVAGESGTTEPTWGATTVIDGGITWYKYDGHLSRAFEVRGVSWGLKTGNPVLDCISQPIKPSFFKPDVGAAYRFAESAYQIGTDLATLPQFTVTGDPVAGYTATLNANVSLSGDYYFRGDIDLSTYTVTLTGPTRIFAASDGTVAVGDVYGAGGTINGKGGGGTGGAGSVANTSFRASFSVNGFRTDPANGANGYIGRAGDGGNATYNVASVGLVDFCLKGSGGSVSSSSGVNINVIGVGSLPFSSLAGIPGDLSGAGGGSGGAWRLPDIPSATSAAGGNGGAGLAIISRGVDLTSTTVNLSGNDGVFGTVSDPARGSATGSGGGGGGTLALLVERNTTATQTLLFNVGSINVAGGVGKRGIIGIKTLTVADAKNGGTGAIIADTF